MTKEQFEELWSIYYHNAVPISHLFKYQYVDRWFRIHSLPRSKRYADNPFEWETLLSRQNKIITDLLGDNADIVMISCDYSLLGDEIAYLTDVNVALKRYAFTRLEPIDLHQLDPDNYEKDQIYRPAYSEIIWKPNAHNSVLKQIADDHIRAFFVSFHKNIIIAPYDGGMDFILKDSIARDKYKIRYSEWLPDSPNGL